MDAAEPECNEQREARDLLEKIEVERTYLKRMQKIGKAPPADDLTQASIEKMLDNQMQWLKTEVLRPASQRLPKDEVPPREVLSAAMNVSLYEPVPRASGYYLRLVRFVQNDNGWKMFLGFTLTTTVEEWRGEQQTANAASMPWKKCFGAWPAKNWAFLLAAIIRRFGWLPIHGLNISYKVQDVPIKDFEKHVYNAYVDIVRGDRYNQSADVYSLSSLFSDSINIDRMNDLALTFDTRLWRVAYDLGIQVDDYSSRPALTFLLSDDEIVIDGSSTRKRWDSVKEYIYARLDRATIHSDLDEEDAKKHKKFLWEVLKTQQIKEIHQKESSDKSLAEVWSIYSEYAERKLGKKLRKIAKSFNMTIPSLATESVTTRCDYCNKPEGEVVGDDGQIGAKLFSCPCNPNGRPYYCNAKCQKADWPTHKEFCTSVVQKKEKNNKVEGGNNVNSKKKKDKKKKKK